MHAAQAWVFLCALGHRNVWFLRDGLHEWLDDVMSPTIADDAPADAQAAFARVAEPEPVVRWHAAAHHPRHGGRGAGGRAAARMLSAPVAASA